MIVRESESVLRIELPQLLVYKLYAVETITASVPGACLTSGKQMRPEQIGGIPFSVLPVAGRAYVSGSLLQEALETTVQSKGASLTVTLRDDEFVGDEADFVQKCISGSLKDEPGGWGAVVMEELRAHPTQYIDIREVDAGYDIEVDIPASAGYSISEPETISVVIPAELLTSGQQIPASPSFVIEVSGATDVLAGASLAGEHDGGARRVKLAHGTPPHRVGVCRLSEPDFGMFRSIRVLGCRSTALHITRMDRNSDVVLYISACAC